MDARDALALFGCLLLATGCVLAAAGLVSLIGYWWMRRFRDDLYEPEAAEAPDLDGAFEDARRIVSGRLTLTDVDQLAEQFDWHAYEYEMSSR